MDELNELAELAGADAETRAVRSSELATRLQEAVGEVSRIRREALNELVADGRTHQQLADLLGMTRSRVGQLLASGPRAERALLGSGALTVAIGGKWEAQKAKPSAVISSESLAAYHLISSTAGDLGLKSEYEVVPPPGMVRLNRANLVVIGSPRLLPLVGQVLEADANLGFQSGARGWYLTDLATGTDYRSPSDSGGASDYAYIGRLPRPDGKGSFLYLAGIHAMGTLGAAHYLTRNLEQLYNRVKARRWSVLVESHYDPDTCVITSTDAVTPVYVSQTK